MNGHDENKVSTGESQRAEAESCKVDSQLKPVVSVRYHTIYADPPWSEVGGGKICRGAQSHYPVMKTPDIIKLIKEVIVEKVEANAHLYLWVTNNHLPDGLEVMKALGFDYKTTITWMKDRFGLGQYYRGITEHCLFGVKGVLSYRTKPDGKRAQGVTGFISPRREHSRKPDETRERIVKLMGDLPRIELFARQRAEGWDCWGNEVEA